MMLPGKQFIWRDCFFRNFWVGERLQIAGNLNAFARQFAELVMQPFLILGGHASDRNCMETKILAFIAAKALHSFIRAEHHPFDLPAKFPYGVNTP
jgi:hypothetical protein